MCRLCGREACQECFEQVRDLTTDKPDATEADIAALQAKREKHAHVNPFFLSCTRRNEHRAADFSPMTRFTKSELAQAIEDMDALLSEKNPDLVSEDIPDSELGRMVEGSLDPPAAEPTNGNGVSTSQPASDPPAPTPPSISNGNGDASAADPSSFAVTAIPSSVVPSPLAPNTPCHPTRYFADSELTDDIFRRVWGRGEPLVVTGLLPKFQVEWTPDYFKAKYGTQGCLILECQSDTNKRVTVGEFFSWFGNYSGRRDCWKLKVRARLILLQRASVLPGSSFRNRIGPHRPISRQRSLSCTKTSAEPLPCPTTSDEMVS